MMPEDMCFELVYETNHPAANANAPMTPIAISSLTSSMVHVRMVVMSRHMSRMTSTETIYLFVLP